MPRERTAEISEIADRRALTLLTEAVRRRETPEALRLLLQHLLTKAERAVLVRRLEIAARLLGGQSYRGVQDALGVSPNLIRRIDTWLRNENPHYRRLFPLRHRRRPRAERSRPRREISSDPASFDQFLKRFPLWSSL